MVFKITVFFLSVVLFTIDIYLICSIWFRGKRNTYLKLFFVLGGMLSFWALFNGINVLLSEDLYRMIYPMVLTMACMIPAVMLRYILYFTESRFAQSRPIVWILTIIPALDVILLLTNPLHHEFISGYVGIRPQGGRLFMLHALFSYIPLIIMIVILLRYIMKNVRQNPALIYVGLGLLLPLTLNVLYTFNLFDLGFDITPFAFLIMFITFAAYSIKLGLFDVSKIAFINLFVSSTDAIMVIDQAGHLVNANPAFMNTFSNFEIEFDKTDMQDIANYLKSILIEWEQTDLFEKLNRSTGEIHNTAIKIMINENPYHYLLSKDIIIERGEYAGCIITLTDKSDYHQIQQMIHEIHEKNKNLIELKESAEAAAKAKTDFLAKMSHEIRTPMNAVMGMSEIILRKDLAPDVYENALGIKNASINLLSIINDILDFSKIESGMMEIVETNYHLASLIHDVVSIIRIRLIDRPIHFAVNVDPNLPSSIIGDEVRVRQILINLLSNAVKYTNEGYIILTIAGEVQDHLITLSIDVKDSGIGIKKEDVRKLFGDFVQIDTIKNKGIVGTGLGLAITRNLARLMGGDVTLYSEYGKGSTFTAILPQRFEKYEPLVSIDELAKKSILLYETRQIYRESLIDAFESLHVNYKSVENIPQLFEHLDMFDYVFISSFVYGSMNPVLPKFKNPPSLVLLSDVTETIAPRDAVNLSLPANSLSIANILEERYETHSSVKVTGASFTAPDVRVLVVDDVAANLKVCEGLLLPYEMNVTLCRSGSEAVKLIQDNEYDLIFMDHMMPEMDGIETTHLIRAMDGTYFKNLPIIALTANAISGVREMFIQNGMSDFLSKPIEMSKLNSILEQWIPIGKRKQADSHESDDETAFVSALRNVPDLCVDKAISIVGGSSQTYERMIRLSVHLLPENIARLNELIDSNLANYSIEVHGIKGVLNNIGAYALGEMAYRLEELSGRGDLSACQVLHPEFMNKLTTFSDSMRTLLEDDVTPSKPEGELSFISDALPQLEEAVDFYDNAGALKVLSAIRAYSYGQVIDNILLDLTNTFERFDFDGAMELLEEWKGMYGNG